MQLQKDRNTVGTKNTMPEKMQAEFMKQLNKDYDEYKESITKLVLDIKQKISLCDPLQLLNFSASMNYLSMLNKTSEFTYDLDENMVMKATEYIQSVLVSSENNYKKIIDSNQQKDNSEEYFEILNLIIELYSRLPVFYMYWTAHIKQNDDSLDEKILNFIVEAQIMAGVRGDRYQIYQIEHLKKLLEPHEDVLIEIFSTTSNELIDGLNNLEYSLSSSRVDVTKELHQAFENMDFNKIDIEQLEITASQQKDYQQLFEKLLGNALYDVKKVTGWDDKLINSLSYGINEYNNFYTQQDFPGWPILDLPVQKKPFIKIQDKSYCFDYYTLFDNIYRVMQKTIKELKPDYVSSWSHIQQTASEKMVEELFVKLLPGCASYRDNYYPKKTSLKDCAENDILVIYDNVLLIIEVKAGSFTYTPPLTDYKSHISSFKALVEKADYQCERTLNYIKSNPIATIYDHDKNKKTDIKIDEIAEIYTFCVTVDNFNEFAAKAEKLSFIKLQKGTIALSIDDLRVYADFFESPLYFIHYIKQRKIATSIPNLTLNDELDHLGLYLKYNIYSLTARDFGEEKILYFQGYREDLDNYFASMHIPELQFPKPVQDIPQKIIEIIEYLENSGIRDKNFLSSYLLDFCYESRNELANGIEYALNREKELGRMFPITTFDEIRYCIFVYQQEIQFIEEQEKIDYIYSTMVFNNENDRLNIDLYYDKDGVIEKVDFKLHFFSDIPPNRFEELKRVGEQRAKGRVELYKRNNTKSKIGRNESCPCGSGKKYKKCCGR